MSVNDGFGLGKAWLTLNFVESTPFSKRDDRRMRVIVVFKRHLQIIFTARYLHLPKPEISLIQNIGGIETTIASVRFQLYKYPTGWNIPLYP